MTAQANGLDDPMPQDHGARILDEVADFLAKFIAYPSEDGRVAHALWVAHTHAMDAWESTPRIAFLSPEPGSGKSRSLEITETLVPRPLTAINVTPAYIFRKTSDDEGPPTILFDEIDTVFGKRTAQQHEDLRALLNAGHRRGATAGRCVVKGKEIVTQELPAYAAVALAGLGNLPDTIMTRSVILRMRRRAPGEHVLPFRHRVHAKAGHEIRDRLAAWIGSVADHMAGSWPDMPEGIEDRAADVWEPLLAVADAAGGDWPERAREAAVTLVTASQEQRGSLGVKLLTDLKAVFNDREYMHTKAILAALNDLPESPWGDLRGKPLDARRLGDFLHRYEISPKPVRDDDTGTVARGYDSKDLHDPWTRYLPLSSQDNVTPVTGDDGDADERQAIMAYDG